jgi:hypothetical protein
MDTKENTTKVWFVIPVSEMMEQLDIPNMASAYMPELCRHEPLRAINAALAIARKEIKSKNADVVAITGLLPALKTKNTFECIILLGGEPEELRKVVGYEKPFEWVENPLEHEEPTHYEKIRATAFGWMRKNEIRDFSEDELWRVFKHSANSGLYLAIIKREIADGLTITSLYDQDHERDLGR